MRSFSSAEKQQDCTKQRFEGSSAMTGMTGSVSVTYLFILFEIQMGRTLWALTVTFYAGLDTVMYLNK